MFAVTCLICFIGTAVTGNKTRENAKEEEEEAQELLASMVSMQDVGSTDMSAFSILFRQRKRQVERRQKG